MPATKFICPNGERVPIKECLKSCKQGERCMFLPTLRAIAKSLDRGIKEPTVTELISGVRETYLKKTTSYAVDPQSVLYSLHGQAVHTIHEENMEGEILGEIRLNDKITSGKFDLFGKIIDNEEGVLGDLKVTSSYKIMKALGIYKKDIFTGEYYKTGIKKGQPKTRKALFYDGVRHVWDWSVQLNYYRRLLEQAGFAVHGTWYHEACLYHPDSPYQRSLAGQILRKESGIAPTGHPDKAASSSLLIEGNLGRKEVSGIL